MGELANRRAFLEASRILATASRPTQDMVLAACETFAAMLSDLSGESVHVIPLTLGDVELLEKNRKKT